jgi:hypothetical protein
MQKSPKATRNAFPLRTDEALRRQIEEAAARAFRSVNREISYRLKASFDREQQAAAPDKTAA